MDRRISITDPPIPLSEIEITRSKPLINCGNKTRFIIALQGSLFLAALMGNITCWNAALIKVAEIETSPLYGDYLNGTKVDWTDENLPFEDMRVDLSPIQISLLFAASFAGSALFVLPATWWMKKIGTYRTQVILGSITTAAAALTPWATVTNFNLLLVLRLVQGMCQCNPYPVIGAIVTTWAAPKEKGIFVALLTGYTQLCAVITTPIASYLANHSSLTFGLLTGSFIVPILTPDRSFPEYSNLFRIYGALLIAANIFFVIFCRAETENFASGNEISDIANVRVDSVARKL
uniref:Major facilitator superfamily (MFS) profile domain-containing protein n=1 Tax=Panagrolaimus sp. ES5 TaxID=591445 RepID=A0AC34F854_9BILA